jgi:hypothetical protein
MLGAKPILLLTLLCYTHLVTAKEVAMDDIKATLSTTQLDSFAGGIIGFVTHSISSYSCLPSLVVPLEVLDSTMDLKTHLALHDCCFTPTTHGVCLGIDLLKSSLLLLISPMVEFSLKYEALVLSSNLNFESK